MVFPGGNPQFRESNDTGGVEMLDPSLLPRPMEGMAGDLAGRGCSLLPRAMPPSSMGHSSAAAASMTEGMGGLLSNSAGGGSMLAPTPLAPGIAGQLGGMSGFATAGSSHVSGFGASSGLSGLSSLPSAAAAAPGLNAPAPASWDPSRADSIIAAAISASNNSGMPNIDLLGNHHQNHHRRPSLNGGGAASGMTNMGGLSGLAAASQPAGAPGASLLGSTINWMAGAPAMGPSPGAAGNANTNSAAAAAGLANHHHHHHLGGMNMNGVTSSNLYAAAAQDQSSAWHKSPAAFPLGTTGTGAPAGQMGSAAAASSDFNLDMQTLMMQHNMSNPSAANLNGQLDLQQQQALLQQAGGGQQQLLNGMMGQPRRRPSSPSSDNNNHNNAISDAQAAFFQQQQQQQGNFGAGNMPLMTGMFQPQNALPTDADNELGMRRTTKKKRAKTFPEKLMDALIQHGNDASIAWLPDNKSFVIVSANAFVDSVLNMAFKEAKYASFVRKLHRWGFVRLTSGTGTDCFHHPLFQRGRRDLASKITCTPRDKDGKIKGVKCGQTDKPPSLAGVERFIRAKAAEVAATVTPTTTTNIIQTQVASDAIDDDVISPVDVGTPVMGLSRSATPTPVSVDPDDPFGPDSGAAVVVAGGSGHNHHHHSGNSSSSSSSGGEDNNNNNNEDGVPNSLRMEEMVGPLSTHDLSSVLVPSSAAAAPESQSDLVAL